MSTLLHSSYNLRGLELRNRIIMSPMTRCRAIGNVPNELMQQYYVQRSGAGLIITEGTSPSPNGLGYARIPGIFSDAQVQGWKNITEAVHAKGGAIFVQLMHTGRISHYANMPEGAEIVAPSAVRAAGEMWTDSEGMQPHPTPKAMDASDIEATKQEFVQAAKNAVAAGFDGIELHGANGYLLEQFLNPTTNIRTDEYGGSIENRCRFVVEVTEAVANAIGAEKVGIRLSPYGVYNDMPHYDEIDATYIYLAEKLSALHIAYVHLVNHASMGAPEVPSSIIAKIRNTFKGTLIASGGFDNIRAEKVLQENHADVVAFGRPFLANPDLVERFSLGAELTQPDFQTFYTADEKGYTDYPTL